MKGGDRFKFKKKVKISSLEAAICNVALFKSMKDKEFRDTIYISYCEDGVILEALSEQEWHRANDFILNFLHSKKIALLTDNHDKQAYEELISRGLKDITRRIKERNEECPYINIIHYQKLRKSCEYMDKEHYVEPLRDWERKTKKNSNFAFLIVEPKHKFDEVKRALLEHLLGKPITLSHEIIEPLDFIYLCAYSPLKEKLQEAYTRKFIEIEIEESKIVTTNYTSLNLLDYTHTLLDQKKNISKSGMEYLTCKDLKQELKNVREFCRENPTELLESALKKAQEKYGENFIMVAYRAEEQERYNLAINKYVNTAYSKEEIRRRVAENTIFSYEEIEFISQLSISSAYTSWKACINHCPFMVHEYSAALLDMDSFLLYLEQLNTYYCSYMVRFYGLTIKYSATHEKRSTPVESYLLIFDYHRSSLTHMLENDLIFDNMQVATIALQLLYYVNFLHSHDQPRCLGRATMDTIHWPLAVVLPFMGAQDDREPASFENDIKLVGQIMQRMLGDEPDDDLDDLIERMTNSSKHERPNVKKCVAELEEILSL